MEFNSGLTSVQLSLLIGGTILVANLAAIWFFRSKNLFKNEGDPDKAKDNGAAVSEESTILNVEKWSEFELVKKIKVTHNTSIYHFKLPTSDSVLPLPIGQHVQLGAEWDGKEVIRSYTPITLDDVSGHFELLVKTYPQGNASKYLDSLKIGDFARFRGPKGRFIYRPNMAKEVGMIAGGTGITPILQVIKAILRNPDDHTKMSLIFGNLTEDDILLYDELKHLASTHSDKFKIHFVLNTAPDHWTGGVGFITKDVISKHCPAPSEDTKILMCGPPPMMQAMLQILTQDLGFNPQSSPPTSEDQIQRF